MALLPEGATAASRFAETLDEASHRFKTTIHRGPGYVAEDGYRYMVSRDAVAAFELARTKNPMLSFTALQVRGEKGGWRACSSEDLNSSREKGGSDEP